MSATISPDLPPPELRSDPLTGLRTLIAPGRAARPGSRPDVDSPGPVVEADDPFLEGHEDQTTSEVWADRPDGSAPDGPGWRVRAFPNLFPALDDAATDPARHADTDLHSARGARGVHEVIVNSPRPVAAFGELPVEQAERAVEGWRARLRAHGDRPFRHLLLNEGRAAGASITHTHAQLLAMDFVPAAVAREREAFVAHAGRTMGGNLLADLLQTEVRLRERVVAIDDEAVLLAPYASRVPYQLMLVPRTARPRFEDDGPTGARLLHEGLNRISRHLGFRPPLNLWVRTAPRDAGPFCWRIDILPRLGAEAGIELGAGLGVNVVSPEGAAAALRDA